MIQWPHTSQIWYRSLSKFKIGFENKTALTRISVPEFEQLFVYLRNRQALSIVKKDSLFLSLEIIIYDGNNLSFI